LLPGYRVKMLDGNCLEASEHRLKELRVLSGGALPGKSLVVYDPAVALAVEVFPCEDGHAQERSLLPAVLKRVGAGEAWVADRNFCVRWFLLGIAAREAFFVVREHEQLPWTPLDAMREVGQTETGAVAEQAIAVIDEDGNAHTWRRIRVRLNQPTRDGDRTIYILTNLPVTVDACTVADLYRKRWTIETAFQELEATLEGELQTLCYPQAALFAFAMALVAYNVLSTVKAALRAEHGTNKVQQEVSGYYLAEEAAATWRGMMIVLPAKYWQEQFAHTTPAEMARFLRRAAAHVSLAAFRKHPRGKKKKPPSTMNKKHRRHVSTARILKQRHENAIRK
jgi:IS4 transposase